MPTPETPSNPAGPAAALNTPSLVIGGLGLLAIGALAAVLLMGNRNGVPAPAAVPDVAAAASAALQVQAAASAPAAVAPEPAPSASAAVAVAETAAPVVPPAPPPKPVAKPAKPAAKPAAEPAEPGAGYANAPTAVAEPVHPPKPVCHTCGVVVAVTPVKHQGEAGALGTVGGAVAGGVVGHQMGGGHGKDALTVLGAIGGALAGRELEKQQRSTMVYQTRIRLEDGTTRTFTQPQQYVVGQHVRVEGESLRLDTSR